MAEINVHACALIGKRAAFRSEGLIPGMNDPELMALSGQTVIGAEMAHKYGIRDAGGRQPPSYRQTHQVEPRMQYPKIIR